jgi:hypothetical protein
MNDYAQKQTKQMDKDASGTISKDGYLNCAMAAQEIPNLSPRMPKRRTSPPALPTKMGTRRMIRKQAHRSSVSGSTIPPDPHMSDVWRKSRGNIATAFLSFGL